MNNEWFNDVNTLKESNMVKVLDDGIWKLGRIRNDLYTIVLEHESRICIKRGAEIKPVSIYDCTQLRKLEMEYEKKIDFSKISIVNGISPNEKKVTLGEDLDTDLFPLTFIVKYIHELQNILNTTLTILHYGQ